MSQVVEFRFCIKSLLFCAIAFATLYGVAKAQDCQQICQEYVASARGARPGNAWDALARMQYLYQQCMSCQQGGGTYQSQPQVQYCPNGGTCALDQSCCGNWCCGANSQCSQAGCIPIGAQACSSRQYCNPGSKCSRGGGCVPEDADDCGEGRSCPAGRVCWTPSEDVADKKKGETSCQTPERRDELEKQIADQKKKKEEEAKQKAADAKFKADAPERKKVSDMLMDGLEKEGAVDLKKTAERTQKELREFTAEFGPRSANCQLVEMGYGSAEGKACALKELEVAPRTNVATAPPPAHEPNWARARLEAIERGQSEPQASPNGNTSISRPPMTHEQLDYLRKNMVSMQPEPRKIALAAPVPQAALPALSTFLCGTPPNQFTCPVTLEAAREKTNQIYRQLDIRPESVLDRLEERHEKGLEYLRDSPEFKNALASIQAKSAGFSVGGSTGMAVAERALLVKSIFEGTNEFRQGKHYEGTLRAVNEVSSAFVDSRLKLPASDVLNLAGAASTAYLYGFFKGL